MSIGITVPVRTASGDYDVIVGSGLLDELGPRFPDMSEVYDKRIRALLLKKGEEMGLPMSEGVYVQLTGPSFETPAEVRFLGSIGGGATMAVPGSRSWPSV